MRFAIIFFFKLYALLTREVNNLEQAWACQKFHACELVKNNTSVLSLHKAN